MPPLAASGLDALGRVQRLLAAAAEAAGAARLARGRVAGGQLLLCSLRCVARVCAAPRGLRPAGAQLPSGALRRESAEERRHGTSQTHPVHSVLTQHPQPWHASHAPGSAVQPLHSVLAQCSPVCCFASAVCRQLLALVRCTHAAEAARVRVAGALGHGCSGRCVGGGRDGTGER